MSLHLLDDAAELLEELVDELVFVGGAAVAYWVALDSAISPRITMDVDTVVDVQTKAAYDRFGERLRGKGFEVDSSSRVVVRWRHVSTGLILDVMPSTDAVFGFGGGWQAKALEHPERIQLRPGIAVEIATPPYILAMKFDAYRTRGREDPLRSHDIEDLLLLLVAVEDIVERVAQCPQPLVEFIASGLTEISNNPRFEYAAEGAFYPYESATTLAAKVIDIQIPALIALGADG